MLQDHYLNLTLLLSGIDKDFIDSHFSSPPPKTTESEGLYPISESLVEDYHKRQIIDLEKSVWVFFIIRNHAKQNEKNTFDVLGKHGEHKSQNTA